MTYRYTVRSPAGAVISLHGGYLGALNAIATIRARAMREGRASDEHIYDEQLGRAVDSPIDELLTMAADSVSAETSGTRRRGPSGSVRDRDEALWRRLKAQAALDARRVGECLNEALAEWLERHETRARDVVE